MWKEQYTESSVNLLGTAWIPMFRGTAKGVPSLNIQFLSHFGKLVSILSISFSNNNSQDT